MSAPCRTLPRPLDDRSAVARELECESVFPLKARMLAAPPPSSQLQGHPAAGRNRRARAEGDTG